MMASSKEKHEPSSETTHQVPTGVADLGTQAETGGGLVLVEKAMTQLVWIATDALDCFTMPMTTNPASSDPQQILAPSYPLLSTKLGETTHQGVTALGTRTGGRILPTDVMAKLIKITTNSMDCYAKIKQMAPVMMASSTSLDPQLAKEQHNQDVPSSSKLGQTMRQGFLVNDRLNAYLGPQTSGQILGVDPMRPLTIALKNAHRLLKRAKRMQMLMPTAPVPVVMASPISCLAQVLASPTSCLAQVLASPTSCYAQATIKRKKLDDINEIDKQAKKKQKIEVESLGGYVKYLEKRLGRQADKNRQLKLKMRGTKAGPRQPMLTENVVSKEDGREQEEEKPKDYGDSEESDEEDDSGEDSEDSD